MTHALLNVLTGFRQSRQFTDEAVSADALAAILEVARWTGSAHNQHPWQFIVIDDRELLDELARLRNTWAVGAPLAIAIVMPCANALFENYDEGRLVERMLLAASALGLGAGVAWFFEPHIIAEARRLLGVPDGYNLPEMVVIGHPVRSTTFVGHGGRKPLSELVSRNRFGHRPEDS